MGLPDYIQEEELITLEEFEALPDSIRAEVHEGRLVRMAGTSGAHTVILTELLVTTYAQIENSHSPCMLGSSTYEVRLSSDPLVIFETDLLIASELEKYTNKRFEGAPDIIMEIVSPSSIYNDYFYKLAMYAKYGVREYWIIDPEKEQVTVYCFRESLYPETYTFQDTVCSRVCAHIRINFARIAQILLRQGLISPRRDAQNPDGAL